MNLFTRIAIVLSVGTAICGSLVAVGVFLFDGPTAVAQMGWQGLLLTGLAMTIVSTLLALLQRYTQRLEARRVERKKARSLRHPPVSDPASRR